MSAVKLFAAMKAFVVYDGKVLILRESKKYADGTNAGSYDVVGGRVQPGEAFDAGLKREILEETVLRLKLASRFLSVNGGQWSVENNGRSSRPS